MPRGTRLVSLALGLLAALLAALAGPVAMVAAAPHRDVDVSASAVGSAHAAADSAYSFFTTNAGAAAAGDRGDGHSNNWLVLFASLLPSEIMSHPVYRADLLRISATSAQSDNAWMCPSFRPSNVEYFMSPADDPSHAVRPSGDAMALASLRQEPIDAYFSARQRARAAGTVRTDILPGTGPAKPVDHVAEKDPPPSVDRIPTTVFGDARPVRLRSIRL
ncbi:hypothetical protein H696_02419 [Fonticula alba]|uniref:Uncharacterized protein n=1 Tax=Fonticula alba TaxID=691883 RepID=A0A058ZC22_FONAL|nr:hypothetical protein H696_02419 [Fonticula alba]KCV71473.1 hypothetical protein H696_02419 [Fonticula alba]|eukprot:XP_009494596.1 hypothetical protein H696_02419 [Fonticula alba]